jgi:hypothetical protein
MKILLSLVLLSFVNAAHADSKADLVVEIDQITRDIRSELLQTGADESTLEEVKANLQNSLDLLTNGAAGSDCYAFAYEKYYYSMDAATAGDKAIDTCKLISDVGIAKFAFEKFYYSLNATTAMNMAASVSGKEVKGKLKLVEFAFEKYYFSLDAKTALEIAIQKSASVPANSLSCLTTAYSSYYTNHSASEAMDHAFAKCAQ